MIYNAIHIHLRDDGVVPDRRPLDHYDGSYGIWLASDDGGYVVVTGTVAQLRAFRDSLSERIAEIAS